MKRFVEFALIWYSQQMAIPFWVIGHVHLSINNYKDLHEIMPIPIFYDPETGKILESTVPAELRDQYEDHIIA